MLSPSKGKAKEETQWSSGWWEYHALLDQTQRPLVWSSTSTIFSAHPTQPQVTARHFSSSKRFVLQSPGPILSSPGSYESPTVISVSPSGEWLFAYFPSGEIDGVGCLWQRGAPIDAWGVKEWWTLSRGAGIVAASWLGGPREWTVDEAGSPTRLPTRGPRTPVSNPTLLLVTETRSVTLCYLHQYGPPSLKMISCPLSAPGSVGETPVGDIRPNSMDQQRSIKICTRAAIGLAYNEPAIIIATCSRILPSSVRDNSLNSMNLGLPLTLDSISSDAEFPIEWENWGEESFIELCEVRLDFDGLAMMMSARPLPPLYGSGLGVANLTFVPTPPSPDNTEAPPVALYLAASYLDFGDYTSMPKSELILHALSRVSEPISNPGEEIRFWTCRHTATRSFKDSVLTFLASSTSGQTPGTFGLYAGILNSSGRLPHEKTKEICIGATRVLKLPNLTDHERWEPGQIMAPMDNAGRDLPLNAVLSFNGSMLLCTTLTSVGPSRISLHILPKLVKTLQPSPGSPPPLAAKVAVTLLSGTSTADFSHLLSLPCVSLDEVADTLLHALIMAENGQDKGILTWRALGLILETYNRTRARKTISETEREILQARWQTALDMCTLATCNAAFEECKDDDAFDLDAVWQLVGLSTWVVGFVEKLLKECVLASDLTGSGQGPGDGDEDLFSSQPSSPVSQPPSSILLHLSHPYALRSLHAALCNVTRFKNKIGSLSASEENSQIAKSVLVDLIDCSGVNLNVLEPFLAELLVEAQKFDAGETRRSLALCEPTNVMRLHLKTAIDKLAHSPVVDKARLFIKPFELMDGVPQISDGRKDKAKDIISKGTLSGRGQAVVCLRCGGRSEIGVPGHISAKWRAFEKTWTRHCICAGAWTLFPSNRIGV
ncbi:hypothetical protein C8R43DRAFT_1159517 [Mycena crocata]|nr:hypothetical protein C8R43DRAFT_1159517 [Mycena crocata]